MAKQIDFSWLLRDELRAEYERAAEANAESFEFHGETYLTHFAMYLLQHLDNNIPPTSPGMDRYKLKRAIDQIDKITHPDEEYSLKSTVHVVAHWGEQAQVELVLDLGDILALASKQLAKLTGELDV